MSWAEEYDVTLIPLSSDDLELVRDWRNSENIRRFMDFQQHITPRMQRDWFESVNNKYNRYYLIVCNGKKIGMSNVKNIDYQTMSAEGGLFIADADYLDSPIPVQVLLLSLDICFEEIGLREIYIKVADDNTKARRLNRAIGYRPVEDRVSGRFRRYVLTKESYYEHKKQMIDLLWN